MRVERIYINTHRYDLTITRICISSIRYWYPDIPISLIIDYSNGSFHTGDLIRKWKVQLLDTGKKKYGWGFGKFEPLFLQEPAYFLVLDADTVFAGPVLQKFENIEADFVVDKETQSDENLKRLYYDPHKLNLLFPDFKVPGYSFNTGQWVGKGNIVHLSDFDELVNWQPRPVIKNPECFKQADQGMFNFLLQRLEQQGKIRVEKIPLMIWPMEGRADFIKVPEIVARKGTFPYIIHWAGIKFRRTAVFPLMPLVQWYENFYYKQYPFYVRWFDRLRENWYPIEKRLRSRLRKFF